MDDEEPYSVRCSSQCSLQHGVDGVDGVEDKEDEEDEEDRQDEEAEQDRGGRGRRAGRPGPRRTKEDQGGRDVLSMTLGCHEWLRLGTLTSDDLED